MVIEKLTRDKLRLTKDLSESNNQITKATELEELAEGEAGEATRFKSNIQAIEMEKQVS